jgi:cytoskeletal protein RodZ
MEINLEAIDAVRERTGCSYSDAKAALEASGGSVVDAIIYLEQRSDKGSELLEKVKAAVREGNVNKIRLKRGDEVLLTVPVTVGVGIGVVGLAALPWWGLLAAAAAAVGFDCKFELLKADGSVTVFSLSGEKNEKKSDSDNTPWD